MTECIVDITDGVLQASTAEEVVRCRDCRHLSHFRLLTQELYSCTRNADGNDDGSFLVEPDGFCAWGQRREDTHETDR